MYKHINVVHLAEQLMNKVGAYVNLSSRTIIQDGDGESFVTLNDKGNKIKIVRAGPKLILVNGKQYKITSLTQAALLNRILRGPEINEIILVKLLLDLYVIQSGKERPKLKMRHTFIQCGAFDYLVIKCVDGVDNRSYMFSPSAKTFLNHDGVPLFDARASNKTLDTIHALTIMGGLTAYE